MDTKARIGLFVGGLVLVGMVAYVMMPHSASSPDIAGPSVSTDTQPQPIEIAAAPSTQPSPATQPVASADPFAAAGPTTAPVAVSAIPSTPAGDTSDAWASALDTGSTQTHSTGTLANSSSLMSSPRPAASDLGTSSISSSQKTYKVQAGDSPYTISVKAFGSGKYASRIMAANPGVNAKRLKIGQELNLPDINAAGATETSAVASADRDHTDPVTASSSHKTYKVLAGDSLQKISQKLYGKADMWKKLYAANKSKIGSDPTHLRAGMVLQLPDSVQ